MNDRQHDELGVLLRDSARRSLIVALPTQAFVSPPLDERRCLGAIRVVRIAPVDDMWLSVDKLVTCIMIIWAVTIFAGMTYLAVSI